jgi:hypothetical protein
MSNGLLRIYFLELPFFVLLTSLGFLNFCLFIMLLMFLKVSSLEYDYMLERAVPIDSYDDGILVFSFIIKYKKG